MNTCMISREATRQHPPLVPLRRGKEEIKAPSISPRAEIEGGRSRREAHFRDLLKMAKVLTLLILFSSTLFAQHRGDNLGFQGLDLINRNGVRATAMGGAFTATSGELDALYWNPAGLIGIDGLQLSANFNSNEQLWRESQDYRPNRQLVTMSFILDGLYTPNPANNGIIDNEAFLADSTYIVNEPLLGADSYSEEAADWQQKLDDAGLSNISAAYGFTLAGKQFVVAGGYNSNLNLRNYDRNITHLSPHPAFNGYGDIPERVTSAQDTVDVIWSDYQRQRSGTLRSLSGALAFALNDNFRFSLGFEQLSGDTDDFQALNRVGVFELRDGIQIFAFSYDTLDVTLNGTSDFSATNFRLGAQATFNALSLGISFTPGYTITREWDYSIDVTDPGSQMTSESVGEDRLEVPASYSVGVRMDPHKRFALAMDLEHRPYADAEFDLGREDATHRNWVDQTQFRFGVTYKPFDRFALLGGYRNIPQVFIPDGAAISDQGPESEFYTIGASLQLPYVRLDAAYEFGSLKYYDVYFSNTNFAYEESSHFMMGLTLSY